jgi:EmrB/QacA subfamily drug resistance transporter
VATIAASAMAFIDGSIVQIALPAIQSDLDASFATLQWVVSAYSLFLGALVLVGGALGDRLGRRRIFLVGTVVFVVASALCGLAPTAGMLVAARALQGVGAALMVPQSLAIIAASFPEERRGRAIGTWAAASALTTAVGPPLGGLLVDGISWRAAFLVNLPIGVFALVLTLRAVPESRATTPAPVDWLAGVLATLGLGGLTAGLVEVPARGLADPLVLAGFATAAVALPLFLLHESRTAAPMVPLGLFRSRSFTVLNVLTVLLYGALGGALFTVPYTLIALRGYEAAEGGLALLPMALSIGLLSRRFGAIGDRTGPRLPLVAGSSLVAAAMAWLAWTETSGSYWTGVFGPMLGIGIGMAVVISPLTTAVMNAVGDDLSGTASGINNAAARVAGLLAVAVTGALMVAVFTPTLADGLMETAVDPAASAVMVADAGRLLDLAKPSGLDAAGLQAADTAMESAYLSAFRAAVLLNAVLAAGAAGLGLLLPDRKAA